MNIVSSLLKTRLVPYVLIALVGLLAYANTFNAPFVFDDKPNIVGNPLIRNLSGFLSLAQEGMHPTVYNSFQHGNIRRFTSYLSFALNYNAHGLDVRGYHAVNILIHILNGIFLYLLVNFTFRTPFMENSPLREHSGLIALFSALLFISHPVQTQAVTYIVQRQTSLATLFYVLSLVCYISWRIRSTARSSWAGAWKNYALYIVSIVSAVLAMKTKEIAFTLPFVIVLFEFLFFTGKVRSRLLRLMPFLLTMLIIPLTVVALSIDMDKSFEEIITDTDQGLRKQPMSRMDYLLTQFRVIVTYLRLLALPVGQNLDYDYPLYNSFFTPPVLLSFLFLAGLVGLGIYLIYRSRMGDRALRLISFGIFWFFITLSVESSIIPLYLIFEHRVYLPSVGAFTAAVSGAFMIVYSLKSQRARKAALWASIVALFVLSGAAYARNTVWQDTVSLWSDVVKKSPGNARGYNNLGKAYKDKGLTDRAIEYYLYAIKVDPDFLVAYINLGAAYNDKNLPNEAVKYLQRLLKVIPDYPEAHNNLGNAYQLMGRFDEAIDNYQRELKYNPESIKAKYNLGVAYMEKGMLDEAIEQYNYVLEMKQGFIDAHYRLGNAYMSKGLLDKAIEHYKAVVTPNPDLFNLLPIKYYQAEAYYNMGNVYASQDLTEMAIECYKEAIRLAPNNIDAYNNLGIAYFSTGVIDEALKYYHIALKINPAYSNAYFNLGEAYFSKGMVDQAIEYYEAFLGYRPDYAEAHYNLGVAYEAKGLKGKAEEHYRKASALTRDY